MSLTGLTNLQPLHIKTVGIGTFDNTVSIGGTLTYEDVTNVDAIGIVTARSGIRVGANGLKRETVHLDAGDSGANYLRFTNTTTGNGTADGFNVGINADENALLWNFESKDTIFATNNLERLRITSDGKVGIGDDDPDYMLQLKGTVPAIALEDTSGTHGFSIIEQNDDNLKIRCDAGNQSSGYNSNIRFEVDGTEKVRILSSGKVLIGNGTTYSPSGMLHIVGDDNSNGPELYLMVPNNNITDNIGALVFGNNVDKSVVKIQGVTHTANNTGDIAFHTSTTGTMSEKIRVTSDGILIINQTSASGTKLAIQSTASSGSGTATGIRVGNNIGALSQYPANIEVRTTGVATYNAIRTDAGDGNGGFTCGVESYNGFLNLTTGGSNDIKVKLSSNGESFIKGGKLTLDTATGGNNGIRLKASGWNYQFRQGACGTVGGNIWLSQNYDPAGASRDSTSYGTNFIKFNTAGTIQFGTGTTNQNPDTILQLQHDRKIKFPSVKSNIVHGESTADIEIGGRHIWKRITSTMHVTTATNVNHFYLAFWRNNNGNQQTCYYRGVVVNVVAGGNYDWSGHGYVTHSSQTILSFNSTTSLVSNTVYNQGHSALQNNAANMTVQGVGYSYDGTYLYANFRFTSNQSGTGWKPHYNVEVIDPSQCTYTCVAF